MSIELPPRRAGRAALRPEADPLQHQPRPRLHQPQVGRQPGRQADAEVPVAAEPPPGARFTTEGYFQ